MKLVGPQAAAYLARKLSEGEGTGSRGINRKPDRELNMRCAWGELTGAREETGDERCLADIYRGEGATLQTIATAEPVLLHNEPADYDAEEGAFVVLIRHRGQWEGVLLGEGAGLPEPPAEGVVVLGVQGVERDPEWLETIQIDYTE